MTDLSLRRDQAVSESRAGTWLGDALLSFYICSLVLVFFLMTTPDMRHWFVLPVLACGTIIGVDALRVVYGRLQVFDPIGFVGVIGFHFFFLAPLLHVRFDRWIRYVTSPGDWREWLGRMAVLNLLGLGAYLLMRTLTCNVNGSQAGRQEWRLDIPRFRNVVLVALAGTALLQLWVYRRYGGIMGYINSFEERAGGFENFGIVFSIAESFPIIAMMAFVVWTKNHPHRRKWWFLALVILAYLIVTLLFGGLRGSRGNTIWTLFWAVGLIHLWVRPVPRKVLLIGAAFVIAFMYFYGFYKTLGTEVFDVVEQENGIVAAEQKSGRDFEGLLLSDLARSDVQAYLLYRVSPKPSGIDYEFAKGQTYIGAVSLIIPRWIWADRPATKSTWGTDAQYGMGAHKTKSNLSSRAYGVAGEGILNFGPLLVPVLYGLYGALVGLAQRWRDGLSSTDSRLLLVPFVTIGTFYFLVWDSDNIVVFLFKRGLLPVLVVLGCSIVIQVVLRPGHQHKSDETSH